MSSWQEKLQDARRRHRPSLQNWQRDGMYHKFPRYQKALADANHADNVLVFHHTTTTTNDNGNGSGSSSNGQKHHNNNNNNKNHHHHLPVRLSARSLSVSEFEQSYEQARIPSVIADVPMVEEWPAVQRWTLDALASDADLESRYFKCGEDDNGKSIKVKLKHFLHYLHANQDDSPLYIFDTAFDEDKLAGRICRDDYRVPRYFHNDLFRYVSESRRPPYRWWLVGPERSGTTVHVDPLGTAAWNTLLVGKKRWVLFPPHVPKAIVKGKGLIAKHEDDEAIHYFTIILPRIRARAKAVLEQQQQQQQHTKPSLSSSNHG